MKSTTSWKMSLPKLPDTRKGAELLSTVLERQNMVGRLLVGLPLTIVIAVKSVVWPENQLST